MYIKYSVYAAIYNGKDRSDVQVFGTFTDQLNQLAQWLEQNGVKRVALESTGIYWEPVWNMLEEKGFALTLVNPWFIKQMPGRKSDVKDAQWIGTLLHKYMLRKSYVPVKQIRTSRNYSRQYVKLQWNASRVIFINTLILVSLFFWILFFQFQLRKIQLTKQHLLK